MHGINFHPASPILRVQNLTASLDYYTTKLGFVSDWNFHGFIAAISRGQCNIMISEGDQGNPGAWVWIGVDDVEALHEEFKKSGATIRNPPTNFSWALEMQVQDLDGNILRFGSDSKEGMPYGPWLDMYGKYWP